MKVVILKIARKYLERLPKEHQQRISDAILNLPKGDVLPLGGKPGGFRLRVGKWRVLYQLTDDKITIRNIGTRGDIYK